MPAVFFKTELAEFVADIVGDGAVSGRGADGLAAGSFAPRLDVKSASRQPIKGKRWRWLGGLTG